MEREAYLKGQATKEEYLPYDDILYTLEFDKIRELLAKETKTPMSRDRAMHLVPRIDMEEIELRLTETSEAKMLLSEGYHFSYEFFDIRNSLERVRIGSLLEIVDLAHILEALFVMREVKTLFKNIILLRVPHLKTFALEIEILGELERDLKKTLSESGELLDSATPTLLHIRRQKTLLKGKVKKVLEEILNDEGKQKIFQDKLITMRLDRYVLPVKQEYKRELKGVVHDRSQTGSTYFIEPLAIVSINNEIKQLSLQEIEEINRILKLFTKKIATVREILLTNLSIIDVLDFTFAKAKLAQKMRATFPKLSKTKTTKLLKARHPLLKEQEVVPLDFAIGEDYHMLLITGPNTGGKTVTMKTVGLLSLMAQAGLFIPAEDGSEVAIYRRIFADIGDEQSIEQSLSTFSSHMQNIVKILTNVRKDDLLLLDEIGAGTDPEEGAALAVAILEYLLSKKITLIATTHYSVLKTFAYKQEGILNASMEFDEETLAPTYRLLLGLPGVSRAFHISKRLGLSENIIARAREFIHEEHTRFEDLVEQLEREKHFYEEQNLELEKRMTHIQQMEYETKILQEKIEIQKNALIKKAKEDSLNILRDTKKRATLLIKDLKKQFQEPKTKKRQQEIDRIRQTLNQNMDALYQKGEMPSLRGERVDKKNLAIGDIVLVEKLGQEGEVIDILGKDITIMVGNMRMNVKMSDCFFVRKKKIEKTANVNRHTTFLQKAQNISRELDLRGMMVDEGEMKTAKFIDDALLAGLKEIIIIHGKGTGKLRQGIHAYLQNHPSVKSYAFADLDRGGTGATIVELG